MPEPPANKTIMRSLGEFFGHIVKAVRTDPDRSKKLVKKTTEEHQREDGVILRRTTIEEVEIKKNITQRKLSEEKPGDGVPGL